MRSALIALTLVVALAGLATASELPSGETRAQVAELSALHDVIYPLWHTAWPAKDTAMMAELLPEAQQGVVAVEQAELPGILRDKQAAWDGGLVEFNRAVEAYRKAAAGSDDAALLDAAELLHMRFEMQVRAIRPVAREVDAYHKVLYVVYHKYLPDGKFAAICGVAADMVAKAEAITKATLSRRLESRTDAFQAAAAALLAETRALEAAGRECREKDVPSLVEKVHGAYVALERVFD